MTLMTLEPAVPPKLPPHVKRVTNKTGRPYLYLMRHRGTGKAEKAIRLPDDVRDPEFWSAYARLMNLPAPKTRPSSVSSVIMAWKQSPEWGQMSDKTRTDWTRYCNRIEAAWGELEVKGIEPKHVLKLRDGFAATPASANNLLRCLSSLMGWSVPRGYRNDNPCREIKPLKGGDPWRPWSWDEIEHARETLPKRLWEAVALALFTGQREGDVLAMQKNLVAKGLIAVKQEKTGTLLHIPIHRDLRVVLEKLDTTSATTLLTNTRGLPWTVDGFRSTWGKHHDIPGLVFHGLRKSAVVTLLEVGCTDAEVAAITGQSREMIEHYSRQVNQLRLARRAILRWEENEEQTAIGNRIGNTVGSKRAK